jgi:HSP20 family protein
MEYMFDRIWGDLGIQSSVRNIKYAPRMDVIETAEDVIFQAEIPGADPEDFDISVDDETLTIRCETKQEVVTERENVHRTEKRYGSFSRTIHLPCRIHAKDVKASYKKGILRIMMPKCKQEAARRVKIEIK